MLDDRFEILHADILLDQDCGYYCMHRPWLFLLPRSAVAMGSLNLKIRHAFKNYFQRCISKSMKVMAERKLKLRGEAGDFVCNFGIEESATQAPICLS
jgi:hypothetical protein